MFQKSPIAPSVKPTRLAAEALRRGAKMVEPVRRSYGQYNPNRGCALCAMATGLGLPVGYALNNPKLLPPDKSPTEQMAGTRVAMNSMFGEDLVTEIEARFEGWPEHADWGTGYERTPQDFESIAQWLESL